MKITVDEDIAFADEAFEEFGSVEFLSGRSITNKALKDTDILIVRSITKVDESLIEGTNVKFVGTATIGIDHIDTDYLAKNGIVFSDAKGCNADSVVEYVFTALLKVAAEDRIELLGKTIGIIGVGNIGGRVARLAETLGMKVLKNDPPKEREGTGSGYVTLDEIYNADIITIHVPLNKKGTDKTVHLFNNKNLKKLREGTIIINTARGGVVDDNALWNETLIKKFILIMDVWENEPDINNNLLKTVRIGTAHIAGYSMEGKINGTKMIYDALCNFLRKDPKWQPKLKRVMNVEISLPQGNTIEERLYKLFSSVYNIESDDRGLKSVCNLEKKKRILQFDKLRKEYPLRREFSNYLVRLKSEELMFKPILEAFRFNVTI